MYRFRRVFTAALALLVAPLALAQSKDPATLAPQDALAFIGVADIDELIASWEKTPSYKMLQDPVAKDAMRGADVFGKLVEKFKERTAKALGVPAASLKSPFKGTVAAWITAPKGDEKNPEPGLVAGIGDKEAMKKYFDAAVKKLKESSTSYEAVGAGSNSIDFFKNDGSKKDSSKKDEDEDEDKDEKDEKNQGDDPVTSMVLDAVDKMFDTEMAPPSLAMCLTDERLYVAATPEAIKEALRRDKGGDTLADTDDYKQIGRQFKPAGQIRMLFNIPKLLEIAVKEEPDSAKIINALGFKTLRSVIGHVQIGGSETEQKFELLALISGERTGIVKILSMENRPVAPSASIPAEAIGFASFNMNILNVIEESERIMRQIDPDQADSFRESLDSVPTPDGEKMSPRKDVLEHLREPITLFFAAAAPYGADSARVILSIAHRNRAALEKFLGFIEAQAGGMLAAREVRGTQVLDGKFGGFSLAVLSDQFVVGNTPAVEALTGPAAGEGLAADATFKAAAKLVPAEAAITFYLDSRRLMEAVIGFAEKKDALAAAGGMDVSSGVGMMVAGMFESEFKEGKFEEARKLLKYLAPQIVTISSTTDGIRLTGVKLNAKMD